MKKDTPYLKVLLNLNVNIVPWYGRFQEEKLTLRSTTCTKERRQPYFNMQCLPMKIHEWVINGKLYRSLLRKTAKKGVLHSQLLLYILFVNRVWKFQISLRYFGFQIRNSILVDMRKLRSLVLKLCLIKYNNTYQDQYVVTKINFIGINT